MAVIHKIADYLEAHCLFPDVARKVAEHLRQGDYGGLDEQALADAVTAAMIRISNDQHFLLQYEPQQMGADEDHEAILRQRTEEAVFRNFGFQKIEHLEGNLALVKLNELLTVFLAGKHFEAVITLVKNTSAMIIDLRDCEGGAPDMVQFVASHFLEANQPLSGIESQGGENYNESLTLAELESPRLLEIPLALLISKKTFSAAEALAYDLQALGRAVIVGETSRGGAHLSDFHAFEEKFILRYPVARALNPISNSNWEGRGVIPDIASNSAEITAQKYLLQTLIGKGSSPYQKQWQMALENLT